MVPICSLFSPSLFPVGRASAPRDHHTYSGSQPAPSGWVWDRLCVVWMERAQEEEPEVWIQTLGPRCSSWLTSAFPILTFLGNEVGISVSSLPHSCVCERVWHLAAHWNQLSFEKYLSYPQRLWFSWSELPLVHRDVSELPEGFQCTARAERPCSTGCERPFEQQTQLYYSDFQSREETSNYWSPC